MVTRLFHTIVFCSRGVERIFGGFLGFKSIFELLFSGLLTLNEFLTKPIRFSFGTLTMPHMQKYVG